MCTTRSRRVRNAMLRRRQQSSARTRRDSSVYRPGAPFDADTRLTPDRLQVRQRLLDEVVRLPEQDDQLGVDAARRECLDERERRGARRPRSALRPVAAREKQDVCNASRVMSDPIQKKVLGPADRVGEIEHARRLERRGRKARAAGARRRRASAARARASRHSARARSRRCGRPTRLLRCRLDPTRCTADRRRMPRAPCATALRRAR